MAPGVGGTTDLWSGRDVVLSGLRWCDNFRRRGSLWGAGGAQVAAHRRKDAGHGHAFGRNEQKVPLTRHQRVLGGAALRSYALNLEADEQEGAIFAGEPVGGSDAPGLNPARQR